MKKKKRKKGKRKGKRKRKKTTTKKRITITTPTKTTSLQKILTYNYFLKNHNHKTTRPKIPKSAGTNKPKKKADQEAKDKNNQPLKTTTLGELFGATFRKKNKPIAPETNQPR